MVVRCEGDPAWGARPSVHHAQTRRHPHRLPPPAPGAVGGGVRRARTRALRDRAAIGPPAPPCDRAGPTLDSRRDHDDPVPHGRRARDGCSPTAERRRPSRCFRGRTGGGGGARCCARARCGRVRDQGSTSSGFAWRERQGQSARVPLAARTAPRRNKGPRVGRPAAAKRDLLVRVRRLTTQQTTATFTTHHPDRQRQATCPRTTSDNPARSRC
jgi:hypothetical protein